MKFKYIIIKYLGFEVPIIFSTLIDHSDMARNAEVVSAGFCDMQKGVHVYGKSILLKKASRPEDVAILEKAS